MVNCTKCWYVFSIFSKLLQNLLIYVPNFHWWNKSLVRTFLRMVMDFTLSLCIVCKVWSVNRNVGTSTIISKRYNFPFFFFYLAPVFESHVDPGGVGALFRRNGFSLLVELSSPNAKISVFCSDLQNFNFLSSIFKINICVFYEFW